MSRGDIPTILAEETPTLRQRRPGRPKRYRSGAGQELQDMAVRVPEVDASPSTAGVELPILKGTRPAAIRDTGGLDPVEDRVKFCIAHVKRVVVAFKLVAGVEIQRQGVVHLHGCEVAHRLCTPQTENIREEQCCGFLVVR